jgi:hypothetical protein
MDKNALPSWVAKLSAQGWGDTLLWVLDAFDPLSIWFSQTLLVLHPVARVFGADASWQDLAQALETPENRAQLRQWLSATKPVTTALDEEDEKDAQS